MFSGMRHNCGQIIHNLLRNAQDALEGHENTTIELITVEDGAFVKLIIGDNGPGFPVDLLPRIF